jgi:hypothetical protein
MKPPIGIKYLLIVLVALFMLPPNYACKAKKCANFENPDSLKRMKYSKDGRVKKKSNAKPNWGDR